MVTVAVSEQSRVRRRPGVPPSRFMLHLDSLAAADQVAWLLLVSRIANSTGEFRELLVARNELEPEVEALLESKGLHAGLAPVRLVSKAIQPEKDKDFVLVSSARSLSRRMLARFPLIHVAPRKCPREIDAGIYWSEFSSGRAPAFRQEAKPNSPLIEEALEALRSVVPASPRVSLITSIYSADEFLEHFLQNSSALRGYNECEHLLFRAGSPGNEHASLLAFAHRHEGAVYINLANDPGLYEVWNTGARVATSRYLSNANVDDRRAPEHVSKLCALLDANPRADVASAGLRVTETPNLDWRDSGNLPVWYGREIGKRYSVEDLVNRAPGARPSRNIPHCMPVWRRSLHILHGYFRESLYGPSSDWEFWLRCGAAGTQFVHEPRPLGLYLRHPGSYWRRESKGGTADSAVHDAYTPLFQEPPVIEGLPPTVPRAIALQELKALEACGADLELSVAALRMAAPSHRDSAELARATLARRFDIHVDDAMIDVFAQARRAASARDAVLCLLTLVRRCVDESGYMRFSAERVANAFHDAYATSGDVIGLIAAAYVARLARDADAEERLLRAAHGRHANEFWLSVQSVYHFEVPLDDLCRIVDAGVMTCRELSKDEWPSSNVWFYPDYSKGNPYQSLLYERAKAAGARVESVDDFARIEDLVRIESGRQSILHLHWIHPALKQEPGSFSASRAARFLASVRALKRRGVKIYWTVHNALSHDAEYPELEREFRRRLALLADRVYVHHPVVPRLLDWLPAEAPLWLVEHGSYPVRVGGTGRESAREAFGFAEDDLVIAAFGLFRDYKDFDKYLPAIRSVLVSNPKVKLLVAGNIVSRAVDRELALLPQAQLLLKRGFLPEDELAQVLSAADYAFLSYRAILTSGSLFQTFSVGVPVIAPALGTIPAYVVPGWNGYLYESADELVGVLNAIQRGEVADRAGLSEHALQTARMLRWKLC